MTKSTHILSKSLFCQPIKNQKKKKIKALCSLESTHYACFGAEYQYSTHPFMIIKWNTSGQEVTHAAIQSESIQFITS